ncbi:hypothetical protein [Chitinophaga pinensis]|uniref:IPT/TIG domain-containing protein n=1 Tax=Chitinophaga pinensis (strain ATCC 43595 / DSM 2588 / LMG 13176 / NBRC 15968 / NCIMB 11800 / UQM 2034) TaxID=485918 RepID=A0A979GAT5_CHIPD|nr:hypothetical protein [Chitinophaga pinensis]ACU63897.1 hypothetical protein Cpin_6493 [Chitinophaga pinensis DSM 2588]
MAETQNAAPQSPPPSFRDNDGNEITSGGKWLAGLLIIFFTLFSAIYLIAHWPDRIPGPKENTTSLYVNKWFHIRLVDSIIDTSLLQKPVVNIPATAAKKDSSETDTTGAQAAVDNTAATSATAATDDSALTQVKGRTVYYKGSEDDLIHINTLLLILVGVAGFLGNMIHISTSFTTFIGAGKFRKSWVLWYVVKPFTAAALAIAIYFVFRGGFLNMSDDSSNINIYGLMTISLLSGLFTDRATLKLKEIFDVLFRTNPKEERPDQLTNGAPKISGVTADPLEVGKATLVTLTGTKLNEGDISITIENTPVEDPDRKPDSISFNYTLPEALKDKESVTLSAKPAKATTASTFQLKIKQAEPPAEGE